MFINFANMGFKKKGQVSVEYLIVFSFVVFFVIVVLGIALSYSQSIRDSMRFSQVESYANKILSSSESVFYSGVPSKATIQAYIPEAVEKVEIVENSIFITIGSSSGINKIAYPSNVPISGTLSNNQGVKKIEIVANETSITISEV
jgi:uncharacterized protein (UPF0333 family)